MDLTEDLSARVLLKHILGNETPRTPITRSASKTQRTSATRSNRRLSKKDAGAQTPQGILRRSLRQKIHESVTRQSLPDTSRRTASVTLRKINTPAATSLLLDDGDTPRHILMNILRTEPAKTPVVHETAASEEPQPSSAESSITRKRPSIDLSGLDLPDITIGNIASTAKGLSRKRPRRSLDVTAFEKRLKDGEDIEEENESLDDDSSLSLSSSTSLSLKTPFVNVQTEKKGLQRRVSNRRKVTEEEFSAAVNKRQMGGVSSFVQEEKLLSETAHSEGFTLGLSKLSEPDITTDILHCNTALYAQPDAMTSGFSFVATQDKPTVMASQLQRQMEEQEEQMEVQQNEPGGEKSTYALPTEEEEDEPQSQEDEMKSTAAATVPEEEEEDGAAMPEEEEEEEEDGATMPEEEEEEEEDGAAMPEVEEEDGAAMLEEDKEDGPAIPEEEEEEEEDGAAMPEEEEEEDGAAIPEEEEEEEEDGAAMPEEEEEEDAAVMSEEEEGVTVSQTSARDDTAKSEEEEVAADSQSNDEGGVESEDAQLEEEEEVERQESDDLHTEEDQQDPAANRASEEVLTDSQPEEEHDGKLEEEDGELASEQLEHISRRALRSEGGLFVTGGDLADATGAGCSADKENSFTPPELTEDVGDDGQLAAEAAADQEEEWEDEGDDEESDEIPSKTPAFVKQKRSFFQDPQASPSVFKNIQAGSGTGEGGAAPKPKQVRQRRKGAAKKETDLPKSYLMNVFKHFAKTKVSADVYPVLNEIMDKYFDRLAVDLETYAAHAKRKTIEPEDAELLLKRQGYVNDKVPVEVLIEKYLRMDQRKLLIPIATSGNVVVPKKRR